MSDTPRFTVNRGIVILRCRQPFLDWLMEADPKPDKSLTLAEVHKDNEGFLVPGKSSIQGYDDAVRWVEKRWRMFFEHMLMDWITDEDLWPKKRTLKMFREWFEIIYSEMAWDLADEPLEIEDWAEEDFEPESPWLH